MKSIRREFFISLTRIFIDTFKAKPRYKGKFKEYLTKQVPNTQSQTTVSNSEDH